MAKLGAHSVLRVAAYRIGLKTGLHPVQRLKARPIDGKFFAPAANSQAGATGEAARSLHYFGWREVPVTGQAPDWFANPFTGATAQPAMRPWWTIPDFAEATGDIKILWEPSRFQWCLDLALAARTDGDAAETLERWLQDWHAKNPAYQGPNWKCGQEASLRVMHLAMATLLISGGTEPSPALRASLFNHLQRIAPTMGYAVGQDNNHGTSEAAALFIGGSWLAQAGVAEANRWQRMGRRWLENRVSRLIAPDGSFSQYSLNYHRMVLDTLCMVEIWRGRLGLPEFSAAYLARARAATRWLREMIDPASGDGPNVGANDGAHIFDIGRTPYRDFRPTVQTAAILFENARAYPGDGAWNRRAEALRLALPDTVLAPAASAQFDDGGFSVVRSGAAMAMLRYPRFRYRPSQCDALHVDLWLGGDNLLGDAGTYSYNSGEEWLAYFGGTASHNTIQFDGRDQMPRIGRFLLGEWLKSDDVAFDPDGAQAGYTDGQGASHKRSIALHADRLVVTDTISGFAGSAVLRWRLRKGEWRSDGPHGVTDGAHRLTVAADAAAGPLALGAGWRSLLYLNKEETPVVSCELTGPAVITTIYSWA
ncbi:heparinase II/III family protein [Sphingomonas soli]|uniref:heparinase II/III family protein n=1 Tax=Sphingomonas soli TaxID=266127 RepID=UPI001C3F3341|nr:alginate lyase family protein [Sphingomonas soli]